MPAGRPTVYSDEIVRKASKYVSDSTAWEEDVIPTVEGLAEYLDLSKDTLYAWAKEADEEGNLIKPEFSDVLAKLKDKQARKLVAGGLAGGYSPVITKLLLMSKHGYVEKKALTDSEGETLPPAQIVYNVTIAKNADEGS